MALPIVPFVAGLKTMMDRRPGIHQIFGKKDHSVRDLRANRLPTVIIETEDDLEK
jgi:hypothetical protein